MSARSRSRVLWGCLWGRCGCGADPTFWYGWTAPSVEKKPMCRSSIIPLKFSPGARQTAGRFRQLRGQKTEPSWFRLIISSSAILHSLSFLGSQQITPIHKGQKLILVPSQVHANTSNESGEPLLFLLGQYCSFRGQDSRNFPSPSPLFFSIFCSPRRTYPTFSYLALTMIGRHMWCRVWKIRLCGGQQELPAWQCLKS